MEGIRTGVPYEIKEKKIMTDRIEISKDLLQLLVNAVVKLPWAEVDDLMIKLKEELNETE